MTDYDGFSHFARIPRPHREGKTPNDGLIHHPSWAFPGGDHLCRAQEFVNAAGLRLVRMPMGGRGVAHPPGGRGGDLCGERPETSPTRSRRSPGSVVGGQGENGPSGLQWCSPCPQNDVFLPHKNARFYGLKTA